MKRLASVLLVWLSASPAQAYLIDLNDARAVEPGTMELELQPVGYFQTLLGDQEHYLLAPSAQLYVGLAPGWDLLYLTRGYVGLNGRPDQSSYALAEQLLAVRRVLIEGTYNDEELDGPSLAVQTGAFLPGIDAEEGLGASVALLFAWQTEVGTLHANVWLNYTQDETFNVFTSVAVEGPPAWPVRPTAELFVDVDDGEPYISGLVGLVGDVSDEFSLQAGVRIGGAEDYADLEVRLSSWIYWEVPGVVIDESDDEESDDEETAQTPIPVAGVSPPRTAAHNAD